MIKFEVTTETMQGTEVQIVTFQNWTEMRNYEAIIRQMAPRGASYTFTQI